MKLSTSESTAVHLLLIILGVDLARYTAAEAQHKSRHHVNSNSKWLQLNDNYDNSSNSANQRLPLFDWGPDDPTGQYQAVQEVTTTLGQTAFLHCRVRYLGDRRVLWMRQKDLHILTSSLHSYTNDWRISAVHATVRDGKQSVNDEKFSSLPFHAQHNSSSPAAKKGRSSSSNSKWGNHPSNGSAGNAVWDDEEGVWSEWTLRIRSTEAKDSGNYECQVSSEPKISKIFRLHVIVSRASILGSAELYVKKGSDINLTCITVADETATPPAAVSTPLHFTWHHNGQVLQYSSRGGGMSITTDTIYGQSRLLLARATPRDSGNYTCVPGPGATPASVIVHVLNGEQPAAMQRDNAASSLAATWSAWSGLVTLIMIWMNKRAFIQAVDDQIT